MNTSFRKGIAIVCLVLLPGVAGWAQTTGRHWGGWTTPALSSYLEFFTNEYGTGNPVVYAISNSFTFPTSVNLYVTAWAGGGNNANESGTLWYWSSATTQPVIQLNVSETGTVQGYSVSMTGGTTFSRSTNSRTSPINITLGNTNPNLNTSVGVSQSLVVDGSEYGTGNPITSASGSYSFKPDTIVPTIVGLTGVPSVWAGQPFTASFSVSDTSSGGVVGPGIFNVVVTDSYIGPSGTTTTTLTPSLSGVYNYTVNHAADSTGDYGSIKVTITDNCGQPKSYYIECPDKTKPSMTGLQLTRVAPATLSSPNAGALTTDQYTKVGSLYYANAISGNFKFTDDASGSSIKTIQYWAKSDIGSVAKTIATPIPYETFGTVPLSELSIPQTAYHAQGVVLVADHAANSIMADLLGNTVTSNDPSVTPMIEVLGGKAPSITGGPQSAGSWYQASGAAAFLMPELLVQNGLAEPLTYRWAATASGQSGAPSWNTVAAGGQPLFAGLEGVYLLQVNTFDQAGNQSSQSYTLNLDNTPPSFGLLVKGSAPGTTTGYISSLDQVSWNIQDTPGKANIIASGIQTGSAMVTDGGQATPVSANVAQTLSNVYSAASFAPGSHALVFSAADVAGNASSSTVNLIYNTSPITVSQNSDGSWDNVKFLGSGGTQVSLNSRRPLAGTGMVLVFAPVTDGSSGLPGYGGVNSSGGYGLAPPQSVAVSITDTLSSTTTPERQYAFANSGGTYSSQAIAFSDFGSLPDGDYRLNYTLTDVSGLSSMGSIPFSVHNAAPSAVASSDQDTSHQNNLVRFGLDSSTNDLWTSSQLTLSGGQPAEVWTVASSALSTMVSDGVSFTYVDKNARVGAGGVLFPVSNYSFKVFDQASGETLWINNPDPAWHNPTDASFVIGAGGGSYVYQFRWGQESSRTLVLSVIDEAGVAASTTIVVAKPAWGGFSAQSPAKVKGQGTFSVAWTDDGIDPAQWTKGIRWNRTSGGGNSTFVPENAGTVILDASTAQIAVGDTLTYQAVADNNAGFAPIEVQAALTNIYVPFEPLPEPQLPSQTLYLGGSHTGTVTLPVGSPGDGTTARYALEIDAGTQTMYFPGNLQTAGQVALPYDLWKVFPSVASGDLDALTAALSANPLSVKIDAWYGAPLDGPSSSLPVSNFTVGAFADAQASVLPATVTAVPLSAAWSIVKAAGAVRPPKVAVTGDLANTNPIVGAPPVISGTATDESGSGLANVQIAYALQDSSGNLGAYRYLPLSPDSVTGAFSSVLTGLTDGAYSLQVVATDNAQNQNTVPPAVIKVIDTKAPVLAQGASFQFLNVVRDASNNVLADASGAVQAQLTSDDAGGTGLAGVLYRWEDAQGQPLGSAVWAAAAISPAPKPGFTGYTGTQTVTATFSNAVDGTAILHIELVDKAGNVSSDYTGASAPWAVDYQHLVPSVTLNVSGWTTASGGNWIQKAADLSVSYTPADSAPQNVIAASRWNVQLVNADGTFQDDSATWSPWSSSASFDVVRGLIAADGQSYRIQLQVQNANSVVGPTLSSMVFTKDGQGPQGVTVALSGNLTTLAPGQAIGTTASASDSMIVNGASVNGPMSWTWSYINTASGGSVTQAYLPGSDIVIPAAGTYQLSFTVSSGSGIAVNFPIPGNVVVNGSGLAVNDGQKFNDGIGAVSGRWSYTGSDPVGFSYRWVRRADSAVLADWTTGDATNSSVFILANSAVPLHTGDVVSIEVKANGSSGTVADQISSGSVVDTTLPVVAVTAAPTYVAPSDVWISFAGGDAESGIQSGVVAIKKLVSIVNAGVTTLTWTPVFQQSIPVQAFSQQRVDLNLDPSTGVSTGDRIVVEVSLENGAGETATAESGIVIVDATAPPIPVVMPMAQVGVDASGHPIQVGIPLAVNPSSPLGADWSFTQPDPESGTVRYFYLAYTSVSDLASQIASNSWKPLPQGITTVNGLNFSGYSDGTMLFFAVKAVNGAGLESIGYSSGIVLDSSAPTIDALIPDYQSGSSYLPIGSYVLQSALGSSPLAAQFFAYDNTSGLQGFSVQLGSWSPSTGFAAAPDTSINFSAANIIAAGQGYYSPPIALTHTPGSPIWMLQGNATNNAQNVSAVFSSAGFEVVPANPQITNLAGNLSQNQISFTWNVDQTSSFLQAFQITLARNDDSNPVSSQTGSLVWTGDWASLGFKVGDTVKFTVTPITALGPGQSSSITMTIQPTAPALTNFNYTRYFSTHLNVTGISYTMTPITLGLEQIQWRLVDGTSGQILQDWTPDYSGTSTSWSDSVRYAFTKVVGNAAKVPANGQKLMLQVRAESSMGVWSASTPSQVIAVDQTPAKAVTIQRPSAYSNASNNTGNIDAWSITGEDDESGLLAYQTLLSTSSDPTRLDWTGASPVPINAAPGAAWTTSAVSIPGASAQTQYYAYVRIQNGTGDWGPVAISSAVSVSWVPPVPKILFDASVFTLRDSSGNAVTNSGIENLTLTSSESGTSFSVSVNGTGVVNQPATQNGSPSADPSVLSFGTLALSGPGTDTITVTATDLYGNQALVTDTLRFNQQAQVVGLRSATTPGQPLTLDQMVSVGDDFRDYPLTYSWNLAGGTPVTAPVSATATTAMQSGLAVWNPGAPTIVTYFQQTPTAQVSTYTPTLTITDAWGLVTVFPLSVVVSNTTLGSLYTNEYWTGPVSLIGMVEVPPSLSLTLDSVSAQIGGPVGANNILQGGIQLDAGATLSVANTGSASLFDTAVPGFDWKGILVDGTVIGSGWDLEHAERGFALRSSGSITLSNLSLKNNLIGAQLFGGSFQLSSGDLESNGEYGIKEDAPGLYGIQNSIFLNNAVDYYRWGVTGISPQELNALPGNGGNR